MERIQYLIGKLKEQFEQNLAPSQLLGTVKLLEAELSRLHTPPAKVPQSTKVAVVMPSTLKMASFEREPEPVMATERKEAAIENKTAERSNGNRTAQKQEQPDWPLDPLTDIPTLSHQQAAKELNDIMGSNGASVNDKLKGNVLELASALKDSPVRELKKAIGVNDRYIFINELFRGDEVMYERSIKTINNFRILPEAEYWMERELKIKLGWDDTRETTRHFYQLVRRRFS
jgi:hypothetical protein